MSASMWSGSSSWRARRDGGAARFPRMRARHPVVTQETIAYTRRSVRASHTRAKGVYYPLIIHPVDPAFSGIISRRVMAVPCGELTFSRA